MSKLCQDIRYFAICSPCNFISKLQMKEALEWLLHETNLQLKSILQIETMSLRFLIRPLSSLETPFNTWNLETEPTKQQQTTCFYIRIRFISIIRLRIKHIFESHYCTSNQMKNQFIGLIAFLSQRIQQSRMNKSHNFFIVISKQFKQSLDKGIYQYNE